MARGNHYYFRFQPDFFLFLVYLFVVRLLDLCLRTSSCRGPRSQKVMMEVTVGGGGGGGEWEGLYSTSGYTVATEMILHSDGQR